MKLKSHAKTEPTVTIYAAESPSARLQTIFRDFIRSREIAWQLAIRDIKAQYRQAFLGFLWAFILPLAHTATWIFLNGTEIVSVADTKLPYTAYVLTGTMLWAILMDALTAPLQHTHDNREMLTKLNFPREAIILSSFYRILFNSIIKIFIVLVALMALGIFPGWSLLLFPIGIASLILTGITIGLVFTPIGLLYTDIGKAIPLLTQFGMYFSPVVYPIPDDGITRTLLLLNPFTPIIETARDLLTGIPPEFLTAFIVINVFCLAVLWIAWIGYRLAMPLIIERMSS